MVTKGAIRQALEDIRRTRFMPQSRSERIALVSDAIGQVIPFLNSAWLYLDHSGGLLDCVTYPFCYPELQRIYASELHGSTQRTGFLPWKTLLKVAGVFDWGEITLGQVYHSEFYKRCMVPVGLHAALCMALLDSNGQPYGIMAIGRPPGQKFYRPEHRILESLRQEIGRACALGLTDSLGGSDLVLEEEGVLVVRHDGTLQHSDAPGRRLLWLASHPYLDEAISVSDDERRLLKQLADIGAESLRLGQGGVIRTPNVHIAHDRGQYDFRVHLLEPESGLFGVVVRRSTPRLTRIARRLMSLQAGPRQKDIAILLSRGLSYPDIAIELGISVTSVVTQIRYLFKKLGVSSREDLVLVLGHEFGSDYPMPKTLPTPPAKDAPDPSPLGIN